MSSVVEHSLWFGAVFTNFTLYQNIPFGMYSDCLFSLPFNFLCIFIFPESITVVDRYDFQKACSIGVAAPTEVERGSGRDGGDGFHYTLYTLECFKLPYYVDACCCMCE